MRLTTSVTLFLSLFTVACGDPCLPTFLADTSLIPAAEDCFDIGTTGGATTGSTSAASESTVTGDVCPVPADEALCSGPPFDGEMWGKCKADGTCYDGMFCRPSNVGNICVPACDECGCPGDAQCTGGACDAAGACIPACEVTGGCTIDGMVCDTTTSACVWPQ